MGVARILALHPQILLQNRFFTDSLRAEMLPAVLNASVVSIK